MMNRSGAGSLYSLPARGTARPMLAMMLTYGLGISLASVTFALLGKPLKLSYLIVFGIIFLVSSLFLLRDRSPAQPD